MKIAIFTDTFPPEVNGVANVAASSAKALRHAGHEVEVYGPDMFWTLPFWGYPGARIVVPIGRAFSSTQAFAPDIIHSHTPFGAGWAAVVIARKLNVPLVGTHHTFFDHYVKHFLFGVNVLKGLSWKYVSTYYNCCDAILSPSQSLLDAMREHGTHKPLVLVSNAFDTKLFVPAISAEEKQKVKTTKNK